MNDLNHLSDQDLEKVAGGVISEEEALASALSHAGLSKDQLDFLKPIELDYEHGRKVYEISFFKGGFEYEYNIDANSGHIVKFEKDRD